MHHDAQLRKRKNRMGQVSWSFLFSLSLSLSLYVCVCVCVVCVCVWSGGHDGNCRLIYVLNKAVVAGPHTDISWQKRGSRCAPEKIIFSPPDLSASLWRTETSYSLLNVSSLRLLVFFPIVKHQNSPDKKEEGHDNCASVRLGCYKSSKINCLKCPSITQLQIFI